VSDLSYLSFMTTERDGEAAIYRVIGSRVNWYLKLARRTQTELGQHLGLDQSTVSKKIRGERPFTLPELYRTAVWLGRQMNDLIPRADDLEAVPPLGNPTPPRARRRASVSAAAVRDAAISSQASDGDTHEYVAFDRDYGFSHNVTSDQMYARVA
jgi:transcriptional regulator with XRE-family HTH domain